MSTIVFTGKQFKENNRFKKFYMILPFDETPYRTGHNYGFNKGIYFVDQDNLSYHLNNYSKWIREVEIIDDSVIYLCQNEYNATKLNLKERNELGKCYEIDKEFLKQSINYISRIKDQTWELCLLAIKYSNGHAIEYIRDRTIELCKYAVKINPFVIKYDRCQNFDICKMAIEIDPTVFYYVNRSYKNNDMCELAVRKCGLNLAYVPNQTPDLCIIAVVQNPLAIQYVKESLQTPELCELAVSLNIDALKYVKSIKNKINLCLNCCQ